MIADRAEAKMIVLNHMNPDPMLQQIKDEWTIDDRYTIETKFGWLFRPDSRIHYETGNSSHAITGGADAIVERKTGRLGFVMRMGTRHYQMIAYEYQRTHSIQSGILVVFYFFLELIEDLPSWFRKY